MLKKLSLIVVKFMPVLLALKIFMILMVQYVSDYLYMDEVISVIVDILNAIGVLILSLTFKFCIYHRLMVYYVIISYLLYLAYMLLAMHTMAAIYLISILVIVFIAMSLVIYTYLRYGNRRIK